MMKQHIPNLHSNSYKNFCQNELKNEIEKFLKEILNELHKHKYKYKYKYLKFKPDLSVIKMNLINSNKKHEDPRAYCLARGIDLSQRVQVQARFDQYRGIQTIEFGHIPQLTSEGTFVINGTERIIIAQLIRSSSGLYFYKEQKTTEYTFKKQRYFVNKTLYIAEFIPDKGERLKFEIQKTDPGQNLPHDLEDHLAKNVDGLINVNIKQNRFHINQLLSTLGMEPSFKEPAKQSKIFNEKLLKKLAKCLGIKINKGEKDDIKIEEIRQGIFYENKISAFSRYQMNRHLKRIKDIEEDQLADDADLHFSPKDIYGICKFLNQLYNDEQLIGVTFIDRARSLSDKRIRLIGDLLKEEILPRAFKRLKKAVKRSVEVQRRQRSQKAGELNDREIAECIQYATLMDNALFEEIKSFFANSELSRIVPQENKLARLALQRRITFFGPGGLQTTHVKNIRDIHWSHYGRLCPVDTPQSERIGLTLSMPPESIVNDRGLIEAPFYKVNNGRINDNPEEIIYLSAAQEEDEDIWIAYYDQRQEIMDGRKVLARKREKEFYLIDSKEISLIDAYPLQQLSLAARIIPFIQHNDANRVLMACSAMRQALPLKENELPLIRSESEVDIAGEDGSLLFGRNLLTAYMPYKGLNFEDAIVVSKSASKKLTSVHHYDYSIPLKEYLERGSSKKFNRWETTKDVLCSPERKNKLDTHGIIKKGVWVEPGDILVGIKDSNLDQNVLKPIARALRGEKVVTWDHSERVQKGERGKVIDIQIYSKDKGDDLPRIERGNEQIWKLIRIRLELERPLEVGDKLANRHGGKGVVSAILDDEDMPYFIDSNGMKRHVEIIINPLSVISRLNLGQLYETHLGWIWKKVEMTQYPPIPSFQDSLKLLKEANASLTENVLVDGKVEIIDPLLERKLERPVTVGYCYFLKLNHLAEDKVHGRGFSRYSYNPVSQQPLQGKKKDGGQRMGEMEFWALEGYNAQHTIHEMLTLKSDDVWNRDKLFKAQKLGSRSDEYFPSPSTPEFLSVLSHFLFAIGFKLEFINRQNKIIDALKPKPLLSPDEIKEITIRPVQPNEIIKLSSGEVTNPEIYKDRENKEYTIDGLFSETIFGILLDEALVDKTNGRRCRLGHISLEYPVFNVIFTNVASSLLGFSLKGFRKLISYRQSSKNKRDYCPEFTDILDAILFITMLINAEKSCKKGFEKELHLTLQGEDLTIRKITDILEEKKLTNDKEEINNLIKKLMEKNSPVLLLNGILEYLSDGDTENESKERPRPLEEMKDLLLKEYEGSKSNRRKKIQHRLEIINDFLKSNVKPKHMMFKVLPVLPPALRPPFIKEGTACWGDLNNLYQEILKFTKCLRKDKGKQNKVRFINNIAELQRRVGTLIDNKSVWPPLRRMGRRKALYEQCLSYYLKGKKGFFRANLLGKRVDYSGRAVIVPDPKLFMDECCLPYAMAVQIFKPFLLRRLMEMFPSGSVGNSQRKSQAAVLNIIDKTLTAKRSKSIEDYRKLIRSWLKKICSKNYILLNRQPSLHRLGIQAFIPKLNKHNAVSMHPMVTSGFNADFDGDTVAIHRIITPKAVEEVPKLLASANIFSPANGDHTINTGQDVALGMYLFVKEKDRSRILLKKNRLEGKEYLSDLFNFDLLNKKELDDYLNKILRKENKSRRAQIIDDIKKISFEKSTLSGITLSIFDFPDLKEIKDQFIGDEDATEKVKDAVIEVLKQDPENSLLIIYISGARGDERNINQLTGMRGKIERISNDIGEKKPIIWSSLKEGMKVGEYFISSYGSRTTLVDKKFGTAEAGYITRQLVEFTHWIRITEPDCRSKNEDQTGIDLAVGPYLYRWFDVQDYSHAELIKLLEEKEIECLLWENLDKKKDRTEFVEHRGNSQISREIIDKIEKVDPTCRLLGVKIRHKRGKEELSSMLLGRVLKDTFKLKNKIIKSGELVMDKETADQLADLVIKGQKKIYFRSPLTCRSKEGVCQKCYGIDKVAWDLPKIGDKVGILAAQSIGEPGTQLVLRTFHHGGIQGMSSISRDIPKVTRFLFNSALAEKEAFHKGLSPDTYLLLIDEIKSIYEDNNCKISSQHFEILLRSMLSKVKVDTLNYGSYIPEQIIDKSQLVESNEMPKVHPIICDFNKVLRYPASWLSSASFGYTAEILSKAAISASRDKLQGLKENIIISKLLPD